jgi:hypothetical protein
MSTPFVNNREDSVSHLPPLHGLLLDPIVIRSQELSSNRLADNNLPRGITVEEIKSKEVPRTVTPSETETEDILQGFPRTSYRSIAARIVPRMLSGVEMNLKLEAGIKTQIDKSELQVSGPVGFEGYVKNAEGADASFE